MSQGMFRSSITLFRNEVQSSTGWVTGAVTTFVLRLGFMLLKHLNGHWLMPRFLQRVLNLATDILRVFAASFIDIWKAFTRSPASGKVSSHDWQTLVFTVTRGEGWHSGEGMSQELRGTPLDLFFQKWPSVEPHALLCFGSGPTNRFWLFSAFGFLLLSFWRNCGQR